MEPEVKSEEELEKEHFRRIVNSFQLYRQHSLQRLNRSHKYLKSLPANHQKLLSKYDAHLDDVRVCIEHNYEIIKLIIKDVTQMFQNVDQNQLLVEASKSPPHIIRADQEKVESTLKQFVREWSEEGQREREAAYTPILDEIKRRYPTGSCTAADIHVLVPGAGLGRLAFEIAREGYTCQGNEFSLFMLFASNFILNKSRGIGAYRLFPYVHQYTNNLSSCDQVKACTFPDVDPSNLPPNAQFSMAAGDFLEVYTDAGTWDVVSTCFFIDCVNNILDIITTIYHILRPGGCWINLGPLLYHYADMDHELSIEPSFDIIENIITEIGFTFEKIERNVKSSYSQNPASMLQYEYHNVFFVCTKPLEPSTQNGQTGKQDS